MELLKIYETLDSTNQEAARLLASDEAKHGLALLSYQQTHGKGQYGRHWVTAPYQHLALTIILKPSNMPAGALAQLSMKISLAIIRFLKKTDPHIHPLIKWPNDIYVSGKKLAGILIENSINSTHVQHSIIGIGMNVNEKEFPEDIPNAISLYQLLGRSFDIKNLAEQIHKEVMSILDVSSANWKSEHDEFIFGKDQYFHFEEENNIVSYKVNGIDQDGKIILEDENGNSKPYFAHQIKWLL